MLRYRVTNSDGRRVENVMPIGLVREFPKDKDAWREADRLGLSVRINDNPLPGRIRFDFLAEHYLRADFGADAVLPKSANTISHVEHIVRAYLVPRFGNEMAEDIKPLDSAVVQVAPRDRRSCLDDDCEDAGRHEPHLQGRHPA